MPRSRIVLVGVLTILIVGPAFALAWLSGPKQGAKLEPAHETPQESADKKREPGVFMRMRDTGQAEGVLETGVTRYRDAKGRIVDLVGAVHIAEKSYYTELNRRFRGYDVVLYELVARQGARPQAGRRRDNPLSKMQEGMKRLLELEFQLDGIDYRPENFVHADLDPKGLGKAFEASGETIFSTMLRLVLAGQKLGDDVQAVTPVHLLFALMTKDRAQYLKYVFAQQLQSMDKLLAAMGQGDKGQQNALIGARNEACMQVLDQQIEKGKQRLAIFYGAAHMADMEERLWKRGFERVSHEWLIAWDARKPAAEGAGAAAGGTPEATPREERPEQPRRHRLW